jgi:hypothetical protein
MKNLFSKLFDMTDPGMFSFQTGYAAGISVALGIILIILVLKIIYLLFLSYPRRAAGITVKEADGDIFITANAVIDLIKAFSESFPDVNVEKISLLEKKSGFVAALQVSFNSSKVTLPEIKSALKDKIYSGVKDTFGIESIDEIRIKIVKTTR